MTKTELAPNERLIQLPFSGFYNSSHDIMIDRELDDLFQDDQGDTHTPEDFMAGKSYDYSKIMNAYALEYTTSFEHWLQKEIPELDTLSFKFSGLQSPREYNFDTDRIFAIMSTDDVLALYNACNTPVLRKLITERCTSYDGFISFYSNDLDAWEQQVKGDLVGVLAWDHNQLQILLEATIESLDAEIPDGYDLMERSSSNGVISSIVEEALTEQGLALVNAYYEQRMKQESEVA